MYIHFFDRYNQDVVLPKQYGYPVGGESATFKYFFMQLHYENPDKIPSKLFFVFVGFHLLLIVNVPKVGQ